MGENKRTSAGTTRTCMREILNYWCECETGIRYGSYSNEGERLWNTPFNTSKNSCMELP